MENNFFEKNQLFFIYNNKDFLEFISSYYSSYKMDSINLHSSYGEIDSIENLKLYIRIILANVNDFSESLKIIEKNISSSFKDEKIVSTGSIKGRLLLNEYVKNKSTIRMPKEYPSIVKNKSLENPENEFIAISIYLVIDAIEDCLAKLSKVTTEIVEESILLKKQLDYFIAVLKQYPFSQLIKFVPRRNLYLKMNDDLINNVVNRLNKGKVKNGYAYMSILQWYEKFLKNGLSWIGEENIKMLIYDGSFRNKLFEFWCLFKINDTLKNKFHMIEKDKNDLLSGQKNYITQYESIEGSIIELYYQKGKDLYWNDKVKQDWRYANSVKDSYLIGIPDISIRVRNKTDNIILIDVKNKVRDKNQNSEEIYKVIGYFSNFRTFLKEYYDNSYKNRGILIYRNDKQEFEDELESDENRLLTISIGIYKDKSLIDERFTKICEYALNIRGLNGTRSEFIAKSNYEINKASKEVQKAIKSNDSLTLEDSIYMLSESNHKNISTMFSNKNLKESLDECMEFLRENHFPHIWDDMDVDVKKTLAMAEVLYSGIENVEKADYSPMCLEYCKAIEKEINNVIITPFRRKFDKNSSIHRNLNYKKLKANRELTLGECIYLLEACNKKEYKTIELKDFIEKNINDSSGVLDQMILKLKKLNINVRRKAAHTTVMKYPELVHTRELVLGIGHENLFYILLDKRE